MFNLENDREDYGRLLAPPSGYELDMAVGTTYSLDLEALTLTAISLGLGAETDSILARNPVSIFNALCKVSERTVIFYESGNLQISADSKNSRLFQLLEKVTAPVSLPAMPRGSSNFPSFHPKTWLLRYVHPQEQKRLYRFVVLSRNLTFDRSWDVVVAFDGEPKQKQQKASLPIADFMRFLFRQAKTDHARNIVQKLLQEVEKVKFKIDDFSDVRFMPLGIKNKAYDIEADEWLGSALKPFHELAIMSPFISKDIIARFNDGKRHLQSNSLYKPTLITRASELEKLDDSSAGNFNIYTVCDQVIDGESIISEDDGPDIQTPRSQDIHAKILMFALDQKSSCMYLGSMNVSHNGFFRNVEFDVCLSCKNGMMSPSKFLTELGIGAASSPFKMCELSKKATVEAKADSLDMAMKRLCRGIQGGEAIDAGGEGLYNVVLKFDPQTVVEGMTIRPISGKNPAMPIESLTTFEGVAAEYITEYFYVAIPDGKGGSLRRIVQIKIDGIPKNRDELIFSRVISSRPRFYELLSFILSSDKISAGLDVSVGTVGDVSSKSNSVATSGIYEKMLEASLHHRERFAEIGEILKLVPEDSQIAAEFKDLYNAFRSALNLK